MKDNSLPINKKHRALRFVKLLSIVMLFTAALLLVIFVYHPWLANDIVTITTHNQVFGEKVELFFDMIIPDLNIYLGRENLTIPPASSFNEKQFPINGFEEYFKHEPFKKMRTLVRAQKTEALKPILEMALDENNSDTIRYIAWVELFDLMRRISIFNNDIFKKDVEPIVIPKIREYLQRGKPIDKSNNSAPFTLLYCYDPDKSFLIGIIREEAKKNNSDIPLLLREYRFFAGRSQTPPEEIINVNRELMKSNNMRIAYEAAINAYYWGHKNETASALINIANNLSAPCELRMESYYFIETLNTKDGIDYDLSSINVKGCLRNGD